MAMINGIVASIPYEESVYTFFDNTYWENDTEFTWNGTSWVTTETFGNCQLVPITSGPNVGWHTDESLASRTLNITMSTTTGADGYPNAINLTLDSSETYYDTHTYTFSGESHIFSVDMSSVVSFDRIAFLYGNNYTITNIEFLP